MRRRKILSSFLLALVIAGIVSGCGTIQYYSQAIHGQFQLWSSEQPVQKVIDDPNSPDKLKKKLSLILEVRRFAETELKMPADGNYLLYADLHREHVVWNVHAAPELSLTPKSWWYPFVGTATYRGYFSETKAKAYGEQLAKKNLDVHVEGVDAYSTLGWFKDPVLNTFINYSDTALAETIFHELAHKKIYVNGDTAFNEAFAVAVEQEAVRRWLESKHNSDAWKKYQTGQKRHLQFVDLVLKARKQLQAVYENPNLSDDAKRQQKKKISDDLRVDYQAMKKEWNGYSGYDSWFAGSLNNAQLNTISTYYNLVPGFQKLLQVNGNDLEKFFAAVKDLTQLSKEERRRQLKN